MFLKVKLNERNAINGKEVRQEDPHTLQAMREQGLPCQEEKVFQLRIRQELAHKKIQLEKEEIKSFSLLSKIAEYPCINAEVL